MSATLESRSRSCFATSIFATEINLINHLKISKNEKRRNEFQAEKQRHV